MGEQTSSSSASTTPRDRSRSSGEWSNDSDSPTRPTPQYGYLPFDNFDMAQRGEIAAAAVGLGYGERFLPATGPTMDAFTPSLARRPPLSQARGQRIKYNFCVFCKNNGEDEAFYLNHTLKDDYGRVRCPVLFKYTCPICGATGPVSHTIKYCPENKEDKYHAEYASITMLKGMRSSVGNRGPIGVIGGPSMAPMPPSKRTPSMAGRSMMTSLSQSDANAGRFGTNTSALRGPNAAWTGSTTQPCMPQMYDAGKQTFN